MSAQPATRPEPDLPVDPADLTADVQYYRGVLQKLIDIGVTLLEQLPATPANPAPTEDAILAYERLTRAIRKTVFLANSLDQPRRAPCANPVQHRIADRKRIVREAEDLRERLDGPDIEADLLDRPIDEIITEICRDLGMAAIPGTHPWAPGTPADIAALCARAAAVAASIPPEPDPPKPPADIAELCARAAAVAASIPPEALATLQLNPARFRGK